MLKIIRLFLQQKENLMKKYIPVLKQTKLFVGVEEEEFSAMLGCLQGRLCCYKKGEFVFRLGEYLKDIAVLVEGSLHVQRDDFWGKRSIINCFGIGEMFGESYAAPDSGALPNDVAVVEDSTVIFFDVRKILTVCSSACKFHSIVVQNLCFAISEKNRNLVQKLGYMEKRSTREKLMTYLSEEARRQNSGTFMIPFNRQQLADFLAVDRSAMSSELGKMRDEGLLRFQKNRFTLL